MTEVGSVGVLYFNNILERVVFLEYYGVYHWIIFHLKKYFSGF